MAIISCANCGADTEHTARFCRKCGNPINLGEATTKNLDAPTISEQRTQHVNVSPTTPSYLAPGPVPPFPAYPTQNIGSPSHKWAIIGLASLVVVLLIALGILLLNRSVEEPAGATMPPTIVIPRAPEAPVPPIPPMPPIPPIPPVQGQGSVISTDLIYPGAEKENEFSAGTSGFVKLRTEDPIGEVVKWYEDKLKDEKIIKLPDGTSVLKSGSVAIVIKSEGDGTSIVITRGGER